MRSIVQVASEFDMGSAQEHANSPQPASDPTLWFSTRRRRSALFPLLVLAFLIVLPGCGFLHALFHFLGCGLRFVGCDHPVVSIQVHNIAATIPPKHVHDGTFRSGPEARGL